MMGVKPGQRVRRMKSIKTYWCEFCRVKVKQSKANNVRTSSRAFVSYCPTCGGFLTGNSPGIQRDIFIY